MRKKHFYTHGNGDIHIDINSHNAEHDAITGDGIFDGIKTAFYGRTDYPNDQKQLIQKYGDKNINNILIGRTPLPSLINNAINIATLGSFQKTLNRSPYDKLYHLFTILTLEDNTKILLEKNQAINMKVVGNYNPPKTDYITVNVTHQVNFSQLLENTKQALGGKYFIYNAQTNNCQDFILNMLRSNNLLTQDATNFIKQDIETLFKKFNNASAVMNTFTNIGTAADILMKGGKLENDFSPHSGYNSSQPGMPKQIADKKFISDNILLNGLLESDIKDLKNLITSPNKKSKSRTINNIIKDSNKIKKLNRKYKLKNRL
jgi:hypothetical protein